MRRYVILAGLILAGLVLLNLLAPLVVFGPTRLTRQPNLTILDLLFPAAPLQAQAAPVLSPSAARGEALYRRYCSGCHAAEAKVGPAHSAELQARYPDDAALAAVIRVGRAPMPAFPLQTFDDGDLADLVSYLRTLK